MKRKKVVVFLLGNNDTEVLLGLKAKKISSRLRSGYGGWVKEGESCVEAAARNLSEQLCISTLPEDFIQRGFLIIESRKGACKTEKFYLHIFILKKWEGYLQEGLQMKDPRWFNVESLPPMTMSCDQSWLPYVLQGKSVEEIMESNPALGNLKVDLLIKNP